jgi:hypothetical protein
MAKMPPQIRKLDDYIGAFYEDVLDAKIKASKDILELFQDFSNLETLLQHGTSAPIQTPFFLYSVVLLAKTISAT